MRLVSTLAIAIVAAIASSPAAGAKQPVTVFVGSPHDGSILYGPSDMLCDMHMCRMFGVPASPDVPKGATVEFGLPQPDGQARIDIRRCLEVCHASVLGYPSLRTSKQTSPGPAIFITPIEMRLD